MQKKNAKFLLLVPIFLFCFYINNHTFASETSTSEGEVPTMSTEEDKTIESSNNRETNSSGSQAELPKDDSSMPKKFAKFAATSTVAGLWGSVSWIYNSSTNILTFTSGGTLGNSAASPWNNVNTSVSVVGTDIKKIVFTQPVNAPTDASFLFSTSIASGQQLRNLTSIENLNFLNTKNARDMSGMFRLAISLTNIDVSNFSTSNVTNMAYMFASTKSLKSIDGRPFDTSKVTNMNQMFASTGIQSIDVSSFDTSRVQDMRSMFYETKIENLNLSNFDTGNVSRMDSMFSGSAIKQLDISSFDTSTKFTNMSSMFNNANSLSSLAIGEKFKDTGNTSKLTNVPKNATYNGQWLLKEKRLPVGQTAVFLSGYNGTKPGTYIWQKAYNPTDPDQTSLTLNNVPNEFRFNSTLKYNGIYIIKNNMSGQNITVFNDDSNRKWSVKANVVGNVFDINKQSNSNTNEKINIDSFLINNTQLIGTGYSGIIATSSGKNGEMNIAVSSAEIRFVDTNRLLGIGDSLSGSVTYQLYDTANAS